MSSLGCKQGIKFYLDRILFSKLLFYLKNSINMLKKIDLYILLAYIDATNRIRYLPGEYKSGVEKKVMPVGNKENDQRY